MLSIDLNLVRAKLYACIDDPEYREAIDRLLGDISGVIGQRDQMIGLLDRELSAAHSESYAAAVKYKRSEQRLKRLVRALCQIGVAVDQSVGDQRPAKPRRRKKPSRLVLLRQRTKHAS